MRVGQILEARVVDVAQDGRGVIKPDQGRVLFCAGVWVDELVQIKIVELKSKFGRAELIKLIEPSPSRVEPLCQHQGFDSKHCGACPWQRVDYSAQLMQKQQRVNTAFARLDERFVVSDIWASEPLAYRNRAQFKSDGESIGYLAGGSRELVPVSHCPILSKHNQLTLHALNELLPRPEWKVRQRRGHKARWTTIDIDETVDAETASINQRLPFKQANHTQNQRMREWLASAMSGFNREAKVLELFCGSGNFTEVIAAHDFHKVVAMESSADAIAALKRKNLPGVEALEANLFEARAFEKIHFQHPGVEILVLDPPREGLKIHQGLLPRKHKIHSLFYISCDLATLMRDLAFFQSNGFELVEVQPLDQFPHTPHIELLVHMRLK
jgi:23S rRNA (uracil1939-C5)-methyltransferase